MTDWKYDFVQRIEIGWTDGAVNHMDIANIVSYADRLVSRDGMHVDPIFIINATLAAGIHQNQKYWEMELVLDSDSDFWHAPAGGQRIQAGDANARAIVWNADNDSIEYFAVFIMESDGSVTRLTYTDDGADTYGAEDVVWCVGELHEYTNERNARHQPSTYRFIGLQDRERVEV